MSTVLSIARNEARRIFVSPLAWSVLAAMQVLLGIGFAVALVSYAQAADQFMGVADAVGGALFSFMLFIMLLVMPLMTMRLFAEERKSGSITLLFSAPASLIEVVLGKFLGLVGFIVAMLVLLALMPLSLRSATHLDLGFIAAGLLGLFLMMLLFGAIGLFVSTLTREPTIAAVLSFGLLLLLWLVQIPANMQFKGAEVFGYLSAIGHFENLRRGVFNSGDVVYYLLFTALFLWLTVLRLDIERQTAKPVQQAINGVLMAAAVGLLGYLSVAHKIEADWTAGGRNTLTAASQKLLKQMPGKVTFTAFLYPDSDTRRGIQMWVDRYKRFKPDIEFKVIDPAKDPATVKAYKIDQPGQVVIEYQQQKETLSVLSESAVTGALQRLLDTGEHYVVFLEGHGERTPFPANSGEEGASQLGYAQFAEALKQKGFKVQGLNLVKTPSIPDNTAVLVVASPIKKLLDGETRIIDDYVKAGGNLLWLNDPGNVPNLEAVGKTLGIAWQDGYAVFPNYAAVGSPSPVIFFATGYPPNPVTQDLTYVTMFPLARPLTWDRDADRAAGWDVMPLLQSGDDSWLETGPQTQEKISFDEKAGDKPGPLTLGVTMTRPVKADAGKDLAQPPVAAPTASRTQRLAVVGDSDFLADGFIGEQGNKDLGINLLQWLASRDSLLNIDVPKAPDTALYLPGWATWLAVLGYIVVLPLLLLGYGITRWVRRRRR
jgi:ABC-type transport system involved in multi-copper enzyme maturation permease subunit/ABC-type uncharacterized transport system involved in gliding motility auxiliary subunit